MTISSNRPCRANNEITCRVHGAGAISAKIYPSLKERGYRISPEEIEIFTEDIISIINTAGDEYSQVEHDRDEKGIYYQWKLNNPSDAYSMDAPVNALVREIAFLYDKDKKKLPINNVLNPDLAATYGGYAVALGRLIAKEGTPVGADESYYSWEDFDMKKHLNQCEVVSISNPHENTWQEFNGTFNDEDDSVHGAEAEAQCACGRLKGKMRIEGSITSLTRKLFDAK